MISIFRGKPYGTPHLKWKSPYASSTGMHNTWGICVEFPLTVFSLNSALEQATCLCVTKPVALFVMIQTPMLGKLNLLFIYLFINYIAYMSVLICIGFI